MLAYISRNLDVKKIEKIQGIKIGPLRCTGIFVVESVECAINLILSFALQEKTGSL